MQQPDAIVVGSGLFGSVIAKALEADGRRVLVLDDAREHSGSSASGCLMKPGWFSGLGSGVADAGLGVLDRLYGLQDLMFTVWPLKTQTKVHWIDRRTILRPREEVTQRRVVSAQEGRVVTRALAEGFRSTSTLEAPLIVVAGGVWTKELLPCDVTPKIGAAVFHAGALDEPFIRPWAPYKQVVAFQEAPDLVWSGDGSALKPESMTQERLTATIERCRGEVSDRGEIRGPPKVVLGLRPMSKQPIVEEVRPGLWVATGGGKNGTILAGWAAHTILEATT